MAAVAVKVAEAPAHIGLLPAVRAMEFVGVTTGFTVSVIPELVAVVGVAQVAFDVRTHRTTCPSVRADVVKVDEFDPVFTPLICH